MTETSFYLAFSTVNVIILLVTSVVLMSLFEKARQLTQSTKLLKDLVDEMACIDRHSAGQVARIAREISSDIGKLRQLDPLEENC